MSKKNKAETIKDVKMTWIEDDIEKVQIKPNLYLQRYGSAGCNHMGREIIQNGYDECIDENSPGRNVTVIYDRLIDRLTVRDDGRGFPEKDYPLDIFCTKIQSGSKSSRSQSGGTAGEFGVGSTVVNALSTEFVIKSFRKDEKYVHTIKFENGKKISDTFDKNPKGLHGSEVSFIPNKKYLGKNAHIDIDDMYNWIVSLSYLLGSEKNKVTTVFEEWEGLKCIRKEKIVSKPFSELLDTLCKKPLLTAVTLSKRGKVDEVDIGGKKTKKDLLIEVSFTYDSESRPDEPTSVTSYCNYTNTIDGGVHVSAVDECICRFLQNETKNSLTEREKEKVDILWQDVRTDMRVVINLTSSAQVQFMGNAKTQIGNKELVPIIKELVSGGIAEFFSKNQTLLNSYIKVVKSNAKARIELNKIKSVNTKVKTNVFADHMDANFTPCNNRGKQYKEIYLVEGQRSAAGSVVDARNYDVQAVLGFRGVTANAYKRDITNIFDNAEWKNYCAKIHYDIKSGDVSNVYYNKIILSTDADSDGYGISAGICAFHAKFARPVVEAGLLYKVYPPLYHIDDKNRPFVRNKRELIDVYIDKLLDNYKVTLNGVALKKSEFREFIYQTEYYLDELDLISSHYSVNRTLIEIIGYNLIVYAMLKHKSPCTKEILDEAMNNQKFVSKLMSEIQSMFPEIILKGRIVQGVIDGKFQALTLKQKFVDKMSIFTPTFLEYGIYMKYTEKKGNEIYSTIGEFLADSTKYTPVIKERYKGLGEANWEDLSKTIMDPARRILVQLTLDDVDRDLKIIEMLHSQGTEARKARKKMMREYIISRDEIDN